MTPSLSASRRLARGGWSTGRRLDGASDIIISPEKGGERSEMNSARALRISRPVVRSRSEQNIPLAVSRSWALSLSFCSFLAMLHLAQLSCPRPASSFPRKQLGAKDRATPKEPGFIRAEKAGTQGLMWGDAPLSHTTQAAAATASDKSCAPHCGGYAIRIRGWRAG